MVENYVKSKRDFLNRVSWQSDEADKRYNLTSREIKTVVPTYVKKATADFEKLNTACEKVLKNIDELLEKVKQAHEEKKQSEEESKAIEQTGAGAKLLDATMPEESKTESEVD